MLSTNVDVNIDASGVIDLDFTGVAEERLIPEGVYLARVVESDVHDSASSGQPALYLTLELVSAGKYTERKLRYTVSLQPSARGLMQRALIGLGYPREDVQGPVRFNPAQLLERLCGVRVGVGTWDGEQVNRVQRLVAPDLVPESSDEGPDAPFGDDDTSIEDGDVASTEESIF